MSGPAPQPSEGSASAARRWLLFLALAGSIAASFALRGKSRAPAPPPPATVVPMTSGAALDATRLQEFTALEAAEREADRTVWAPERRAEERAAAIERLWDSLNAAPDPLRTLRDAPIGTLLRPEPKASETLPHGILRTPWVGSSPGRIWDDWRTFLDQRHAEGWRLTQSEWRHLQFSPASPGSTEESSLFEVRLDLERESPRERAQVQARIRISWPPSPAAADTPELGLVQIDNAEVLTRTGDVPFETVDFREINPFPRTSWIDPILLRDLDHNGQPEILLLARNLLLRRNADGAWQEETLSPHHPGLLFTGILADFNGDGTADLLIAVRTGLILLPGDARGRFDAPPIPAWTAPERLHYAQALTCGDLDGDGDADVFLGQYRTPYEGGQMPTPYFDARDGPPAYLLRNDGQGRFTDITVGSGLEPFRHRRSYAASFVELDGDGDLDLVVTSDFAGMDVHENDGHGHFLPRTASWLGEAHGFGMSHSFSDFNADGALDLLMVAMPQPTADRLTALGLERPGFEAWRDQRPAMTFGNRLFFGNGKGFRQPPVGNSVARAGWAWSAPAFDLDHDRLPDLHIVNGHETRRSVRDYESEFWTQDIYLKPSTPPATADAFFAAKFAATRANGWSYGGYDKNRLLMNLGPAGFVEIGHLFGLALEADSRNAVAEDFDGDGTLDLLVTTFEIWPRPRQTLRIFANRLKSPGHWLGLRLPTGRDVPGPEGAVVTVRDRLGAQVRTYALGEGYRSQGQPLLRFGLGDVERIDSVEVRWPGGLRSLTQEVGADRIHEIDPPTRASRP